jgi:hypothetical protein
MAEESNLLDVVQGKKPELSAEVKTPETPTETPTEDPVETPVETPIETPVDPPVDPIAVNPIEILNKELGTEFKEPTEIKNILEKAKTLEVEILSWQDKYKQLEDSVLETQDPLSYFANEDEYRRQLLLKSNPDLNASEINKLFGSDIDKLDPVQTLEMQLAIQNPEFTKEEIGEYLKKKYDYDPEVDTKPPADMTLAAKEAKKELNKLKTSVEIPKKVDLVAMRENKQKEFEQTINKIKADFEPIVNKLAESMNDLELFDGFKFQIEPEAKAEASKQMLDILVDSGAKMDVNAEKYIADARATVLTNYFIKNSKRIMESYAAQKVADRDKEWEQKVHNPKPINDPPPPATGERPDTDVVKIVSG